MTADQAAQNGLTRAPIEVTKKTKRSKTNHNTTLTVLRNHPLGIQPIGNLIVTDKNDEQTRSSQDLRARQLGSFARLPDELILLFLQTLDARQVRFLGYTSRIFNAFASQEEIWKQLYVESRKSPARWCGTWRRTYYELDETLEAANFTCSNFYSDVLYRPFFCSAINLTEYLRATSKSSIRRLKQSPTQEEFDSKLAYEPFIIESHLWPAWKIFDLAKEYGSIDFIQEAVRWKLDVYDQYMDSNKDESPLYLFDKEFADKTELAKQYEVPTIFKTDYFNLLGSIRPDYRWIIIGPERSGSTFHKDPNNTSAWNAIIEGEKYWVMFPPDSLPPGVFTTEDESEVTSPLSIAEWFLSFHKVAISTLGFVDGFCKKGEVLHVPSGWWHLVVNLAPTIAITQNFVPRAHVLKVLKFFKDKKNQVSGFNCGNQGSESRHGNDDDDDEQPDVDLFEIFLQKIRHDADNIPGETISRIENWVESLTRESKWDRLVDDKSSSFNFGFADSDEE
ncbi:hypothetical protein V1514DRAFT_327056 [Lipomyces japonicus]|uniref:uncharacterized protein n=1 Tax=Lipomyces japonicus TaxID=56871 RepID=UPI0034CE001E